ncbi:polyhydroxyalkanoate granule-associated phasin [Ramlibacter sp.]|uniref:polyhydroxyalkanoate granule-associated phasin n=1 Tax=Ramlibacter sp. TaxID=1917967 RepID=UPI003D11FC33
MSRSTRSAAPLALKLAEVGFATPQVMAMRLSRMALAGASPSPRDQAENRRMVDEKVAAFSQSWLAIWMNLWMMPMRLAPAFVQSLGGGRGSQNVLQQSIERASTAMFAAGLAPVHRTVTANARRLSRGR